MYDSTRSSPVVIARCDWGLCCFFMGQSRRELALLARAVRTGDIIGDELAFALEFYEQRAVENRTA